MVICYYIMNKYKTINTQSPRQSLENAIQTRMINNQINRLTIDQGDLMSTNKSIIFIKMPKSNNQTHSEFKTSLYQSSLKRLKKQHPTIIKEVKIPSIAGKKNTYQQFEEETIRKMIKQKKSQKKQVLPQVNMTPTKKDNINQRIQSQLRSLEEHSFEDDEQNNQDSKPTIFQVDLSVIGFTNLKKKYLQLRQISLSTKKKSELLQKQHSRRSYYEDDADPYYHKFKMDKQIEEHMNRYSRKDYFQTKLNGFKTTLYPSEKNNPQKNNSSLPKHRKRQCSEDRDGHRVSNFIKRRKMKSSVFDQYFGKPQKSAIIKNSGQYQSQKQANYHSKRYKQTDDCTPWETELVNFD